MGFKVHLYLAPETITLNDNYQMTHITGFYG